MNLGWSPLDGSILQACLDHVDHSYLLYQSVDYDDCLAQFFKQIYVLKEEQCQAVLGLITGVTKGFVAVLPTGFWKSLVYQLFAAVKLKRREKNVEL